MAASGTYLGVADHKDHHNVAEVSGGDIHILRSGVESSLREGHDSHDIHRQEVGRVPHARHEVESESEDGDSCGSKGLRLAAVVVC